MAVMLSILDPTSSIPARQHCPTSLLDEDAASMLDAAGNCRQWVERLVAGGYAADALRLLTRLLPKKYALAWGCECLRRAQVQGQDPAREVNRAGIALAERWLTQPTEEHRRAALDFAEQGEFATAGAWIAAAAGWADGSLAPKNCEPVPPPDTLTGEAVFAALVSCALAQPEGSEAQLMSFVQSALAAFGTSPGTSRGH